MGAAASFATHIAGISLDTINGREKFSSSLLAAHMFTFSSFYNQLQPEVKDVEGEASSSNNQWMLFNKHEDSELMELEANDPKQIARAFGQSYIVFARNQNNDNNNDNDNNNSNENDKENKDEENDEHSPEGGLGVVIIAESVELESLVEIVAAVQSAVSACTIPADAIILESSAFSLPLPLYQINMGLNISNNSNLNINDKTQAGAGAWDEVVGVLRRLQYLSIGGSNVTNLSEIMGTGRSVDAVAVAGAGEMGTVVPDAAPVTPASVAVPELLPLPLFLPVLPQICCLQVLDLSYTPGLILDAGCFMSCVVLKRLVLDGCGLKSTLLEAGVDYNGFVTSPVAVARGVESDLEELEAEKAQEGSALSIADAENDAKIVKLLEALSSSDQEQIDEHERQEQLRERVDKLNQLRSQYCHSSIFTGLISLQELSLNENLFATYYSLGGLVLLEKLRSISLVENPLREKAHTSKYVDNVLFMSTLGPGFSFISGSGFSGSDAVTSTSTSKGSNITSTFSSSTISSSSLISIDGKRIHSASSLQSMHTNNQAIVLQHVNIHGITGIGNAASVDGMEREVQMELRGEKDITVVA